MSQPNSKARTLNFRKTNFQLFQEVSRIPWENSLKDKGAELSWQIFKDISQEGTASETQVKEIGQGRQETGWLCWDLLAELKGKNEMHRQWKNGPVLWKEYRNTVWLYRWGQEGQGVVGAELGK